MNCRSAESLFSSYIEDEISQEERRNLESHLMGCRRCSLAMREVRATMSLLEQMPAIAPSQNFDEDVYARVRSGEEPRASAAELIRELLSPVRLRPVFIAGAGVCAVFIAVLVSPVGQSWMRPSRSAPPMSAARTQGTGAPTEPGIASAPAPTVAGPIAPVRGSGRAPAERAASVVASVAHAVPADSILDGRIPRQSYSDEIINDQFYLERGRQGQDPAVVPVNDTADDGVYIVF